MKQDEIIEMAKEAGWLTAGRVMQAKARYLKIIK